MDTVAFSSVTRRRGVTPWRRKSCGSVPLPSTKRCFTLMSRRDSSSSGSTSSTEEPECSMM